MTTGVPQDKQKVGGEKRELYLGLGEVRVHSCTSSKNSTVALNTRSMADSLPTHATHFAFVIGL